LKVLFTEIDNFIVSGKGRFFPWAYCFLKKCWEIGKKVTRQPLVRLPGYVDYGVYIAEKQSGSFAETIE